MLGFIMISSRYYLLIKSIKGCKMIYTYLNKLFKYCIISLKPL